MSAEAATRTRIVLATGNAGKAREFNQLLGNTVELVLQSELGVIEVEETGTTFLDNALLKARHASAVTGLPAIADDSGLEVDALDGAPGVYSARHAGENASNTDNVDKLLATLNGVAADQRGAQFTASVVFVRSADDAAPLVAKGVWRGSIAAAPRGAGGFGYDPVFIDSASGATSAELPPEKKNARSHRGQAVRMLCEMMQDVLA